MQNQVSTILLLVAAVTVVIEIQHLREDVESPNDGRSSINHNIDKPEVAYHKSNVQIETCNTRSPKKVCFQPVLLRFFGKFLVFFEFLRFSPNSHFFRPRLRFGDLGQSRLTSP